MANTNEVSQQYFKIFGKLLLTIIIASFLFFYFAPYKETLSCYKQQNTCTVEHDYLFKKDSDYIPLDNLKNIQIQTTYRRLGRSYSLEYYDNNGIKSDIFLTNYSAKTVAKDVKNGITNYLNSNQKTFALVKYVPTNFILLVLATLVLIISIIFYIRERKQIV